MADPDSSSAKARRRESFVARTPMARLVQKLREHAPNSRQFIRLLSLLMIGTVLILLIGLAVTVTVIALVFFTPLIILSSPIWVPLGIFLFLAAAATFSTCGFGVAVVAGSSWIYKFFLEYNRPGSDRVDFGRSRVHDAASHLKGYAVEYSECWQRKVKDAAPCA